MGFGRSVGRVLLSLIFLLAGFGKLRALLDKFGGDSTAWDGLVQYSVTTGHSLFSQVPKEQVGPFSLNEVMVIAAGVAEFVGGLSLVVGSNLVAALFLVPFLAIMTPVMHMPENAQDTQAIVQFLKNLGLLGALLILNDTETVKAKKD